MELTDVFGNKLKKGHDKLELSMHDIHNQVIVKGVDSQIEKRYRKLVLEHYKKIIQ